MHSDYSSKETNSETPQKGPNQTLSQTQVGEHLTHEQKKNIHQKENTIGIKVFIQIVLYNLRNQK